MCRVYYKEGVRYVRLCYRTGHKGVRIPAVMVRWNESHTHVLQKPRIERLCGKCGKVLRSWERGYCLACREELDREAFYGGV